MRSTYLNLIMVLIAGFSYAQNLEDLNAPTFPAASIIGTEINEISRPTSLTALKANLTNNFLDSNNRLIIPDNYGIEITPYMLSKRSNFSYLDYIDNSKRWKDNFYRTLSFSVASTKKYVVNDSVSTDAIGFGMRTVLYNGRVSEELADEYKSALNQYVSSMGVTSRFALYIREYIRKLKGAPFKLNDLKNYLLSQNDLKDVDSKNLIKNAFNNLGEGVDASNAVDKVIKALEQQYAIDDEREDLVKLLDRVKTERMGFHWELNGAVSLNFPTNNFEFSYAPRVAGWSNMSYRFIRKDKSGKKEASNFEVQMLNRYIWNNGDFMNAYVKSDSSELQPGNLVDLGFRLNYYYNEFSVGCEFIGRWNRQREYVTVDGEQYSKLDLIYSNKFVLNVNYRLNDNLVLTYNIGKNYDYLSGSQGNLISGFSINAGVGKLDAKKEAIKDIVKL